MAGWRERRAVRTGFAVVITVVVLVLSIGVMPDRWRLAVLRVFVQDGTWSDPAVGLHRPAESARKETVRASEPATLDEPFDRLEGMAAKRRIIALLERGIERLRALDGYTATFHRTERIKDALGRPQTIAEKVRHRPFSVYMRWISPFAGQEAIYVEGQNDGRMVAHLSGLGRILSPRTLLAPDDPLLRATSRHPITKSGLLNMNEVFLEYRRAELEQTDSRVTLKPAIEAGRPGLLCEHVHFSDHGGTYPYHRVTGFIDKDFGFITHYESYAWPALSSKPSHAEPESPLLERYSYSDIDLHPTLRDSDFSPDNPTYAFHRF